MKKIMIALVIGYSLPLSAMQLESYLKLLPQELKQELVKFTTNLSNVLTIDELLQGIREAANIKSSQALNTLQQQLELIKTQDYTNAIDALQTLSNDKDLAFFFNSPNFNRILISELSSKDPSKELKNIAQELNTSGALESLRQREFIDAAEKGDINTVQEFLSKGINSNAQDKYGLTALHRAAQKGHKDITETLIKAGANIHHADNLGHTALHWAARAGQKDIIEILLSYGANIDARDKYDKTPFMDAVYRRGHYMDALCKGHKDVAELLIAKGTNVNAQNKDGKTALIFAVYDESKDIVEMLINAGADVNVQDKYGYTALMITTQCGNKEIVELLKKHGAKQ